MTEELITAAITSSLSQDKIF